jgi:hypothetical protein
VPASILTGICALPYATSRSYEEVMEVYDECMCFCHDEDEEDEDIGE